MNVSPVTHVRYVAHAVPDYEAALDFYSGIFGLRKVDADTDIAFLAAEGSTEPFALRLRKAKGKHLDLMSLAVADVPTVDRLAAEFIETGVRIDREPARLDIPGGGYGFRFFDPDGRLVEISADVTPRDARELDEGESIPVRVSHVVINSPNLAMTRQFYEDRLGFVLRDWLGDFMCFLQAGIDHHLLAITAAPHVSFNHVSFEIRGLNEYLCGTGRLIYGGIRPAWGPGRHGPGNNTFSYFVDPASNVAEYTYGMLQIPDPESYPVKTWSPSPEESDQWGTAGPFEEYLPYALGTPDSLIWTPSPV